MPGDRNRDNIYEVTVVASDGTMEAMRSVTVKVTDADEAGKVTLSTQDALTGASITATLTDSDGGVTGVKWTWHRLDDAGTSGDDDNDIPMATSDTYTPVFEDEGKFLKAMARYVDRTYDEDNDEENNSAEGFEGFMNMATSMATTMVRDDPANETPEFKDSSAQRFVMENTAENMAIGMPVTATDNDAGQTLTYSLGGADKDSFTIDQATSGGDVAGQIKTKAKLDHESKSTYRVTVMATDSSGESNDSGSIPVTIMVTDMDEGPTIFEVLTENQAPVFRSSSTTRSIPEGQSSDRAIGSAVAATDPGDSLTYTLEGTDAASFSIDRRTGQLRTSASLDHNTKSTYTVIVKATDRGGLSDTITVTITVTEVDDMVGPVPADPLLAEYDPNGDGVIEKADMRKAVGKFFAEPPELTRDRRCGDWSASTSDRDNRPFNLGSRQGE